MSMAEIVIVGPARARGTIRGGTAHAAIRERIADRRVTGPKKQPLTVVAYEAGDITRG
jgi:hypothetical protein